MKKLLSLLFVLMLVSSYAHAEENNREFAVKMEYTVYMIDVDRTGLYTGELQNGVPHGYGVFTAVNDSGVSWHYIGEWEKGVMQGEGGQYWDIGKVNVGSYRDNEFMGGTIVQPSEEIQHMNEESYAAAQALSQGKNPVVIEEQYNEIAYSSLARNPEDHLYKLIKFDGTIVQVLGSRKQGYELRIATKNNYDDIIYVWVAANVGLTGNLLVDDQVTIYGMFAGDVTYDTTEGTKLTIPSMQVFRVDLQE
ncbi:MAG: hypothetical protein IKK08_06715 [Clostridia bacterium]|nr:hypothetical protein [Clostridia bacterium]